MKMDEHLIFDIVRNKNNWSLEMVYCRCVKLYQFFDQTTLMATEGVFRMRVESKDNERHVVLN